MTRLHHHGTRAHRQILPHMPRTLLWLRNALPQLPGSCLSNSLPCFLPMPLVERILPLALLVEKNKKTTTNFSFPFLEIIRRPSRLMICHGIYIRGFLFWPFNSVSYWQAILPRLLHGAPTCRTYFSLRLYWDTEPHCNTLSYSQRKKVVR